MDVKDPIMPGVLSRPLHELTLVRAFVFNDSTAAVGSHQLERPVGRAGIRDKNLVGDILDGFQTRQDRVGVVKARDQRSDELARPILRLAWRANDLARFVMFLQKLLRKSSCAQTVRYGEGQFPRK